MSTDVEGNDKSDSNLNAFKLNICREYQIWLTPEIWNSYTVCIYVLIQWLSEVKPNFLQRNLNWIKIFPKFNEPPGNDGLVWATEIFVSTHNQDLDLVENVYELFCLLFFPKYMAFSFSVALFFAYDTIFKLYSHWPVNLWQSSFLSRSCGIVFSYIDIHYQESYSATSSS